MQTMIMTLVPLPLWALGIGGVILAAVGFVAGVLWNTLVPDRDTADSLILENTRLWRELAAEQSRADRWRSLYERLLSVDGLSPAARALEERALAKEAQELRGDAQRISLRAKTAVRFKPPCLQERRA